MWEVFYSDGTSISSDEVSPFEIENHEDVQVVIQEDKDHRWKTITTDYVVWDNRGHGWKWWGCTDLSALLHYLRQPGCKCVLFGTWIEKDDFNKIFNDARKKWVDKIGFASDERQP